MCSARAVLAASALLALAVAACTPVTQLLVVVRTDLPAEDVAEVHIAVVPGEPFTSAPTTRQAVIGEGEGRTTLPFSFGVLPRNGDPRSRVEITVSAIDAAGLTTVTRLVRTGFSEGRTLAVPVFLGAACRDRRCEPGLTCVEGACVSPEVPVEDLVPVRPGEELGDAGRAELIDAASGEDAGVGVDAGSAAGVGLPRPTRDGAVEAGAYVFVTAIVPAPDGGVFVLADAGGRRAFGLSGTERAGRTALVVRLDAALAPVWAYTLEGTSDVRAAALSGQRLFVCGSFDGTLIPDGLEPITASSDGMDDSDDEAFVLELAVGGLAPVPTALHRLQAGGAARCERAAVSGSVLAGWLDLLDAPEVTFDGAPVAIAGCPLPDAAVLRFDLTSGLRAAGGLSFGERVVAGGDLAADGAGGFFVAVSSVQSGQENVNRSCGAGGASLSADLLAIDATGGIAWGRTLLEMPELGPNALVRQSIALTGDRVVSAAAFDTISLPYSIVDALGGLVAPSAAAPRLVLTSVRASDGNDARSEVTAASVRGTRLVGREPDVALCGQTPFEGVRTGFVSDLFGASAPSGAAMGFVVSLGPEAALRWGEWAEGDQGWMGDCASDGRGGLFVAPTFLNLEGSFRGHVFQGSAIVHVEP